MNAPRTLDDIFEGIRAEGDAGGTLAQAKKLIYDLRNRAVNVQSRAFVLKNKPRVLVLEEVDPPRGAGRWVPEMVEIAGGVVPQGDALPNAGDGGPVLVSWDSAARFNPDVLILAPGGGIEGAVRKAGALSLCPVRNSINAFKAERIYAVDADAYFARPGPRVIDGIELLAHILHPKVFQWRGPSDAFAKVEMEKL